MDGAGSLLLFSDNGSDGRTLTPLGVSLDRCSTTRRLAKSRGENRVCPAA